jgi:hypothetical protein
MAMPRRPDPKTSPGAARAALTFGSVLGLLGMAMIGGPAGAAGPGSAECRRALQVLDAREADVMAARPWATTASEAAARQALRPVRQAAARACLGGTGDPPPPTARAMPPAEMSRAAPTAGTWQPVPLPVRPPPAVSPPPQPPADRAITVTHCDASGCWASDGVWRPRVGGTLGGARGPCSPQGAIFHCP